MNRVQYINRFENYLSTKRETFRDNPNGLFFSVSDNDDNHSAIFINLDNFTVGIGNSCEFFDGMEDELHLALWRFLTLLTCKIKRTEYLKGNWMYKVKYETVSGTDKHFNSTSLTWLFPYWMRTKTIEIIQEPLFGMNEIEKEFNDIKMAAHNKKLASVVIDLVI